MNLFFHYPKSKLMAGDGFLHFHRLPITYGAMSSAGLETTKLPNYDEVNK